MLKDPILLEGSLLISILSKALNCWRYDDDDDDDDGVSRRDDV